MLNNELHLGDMPESWQSSIALEDMHRAYRFSRLSASRKVSLKPIPSVTKELVSSSILRDIFRKMRKTKYQSQSVTPYITATRRDISRATRYLHREVQREINRNHHTPNSAIAEIEYFNAVLDDYVTAPIGSNWHRRLSLTIRQMSVALSYGSDARAELRQHATDNGHVFIWHVPILAES